HPAIHRPEVPLDVGAFPGVVGILIAEVHQVIRVIAVARGVVIGELGGGEPESGVAGPPERRGKGPEVVIEGAILLTQDDDVLDLVVGRPVGQVRQTRRRPRNRSARASWKKRPEGEATGAGRSAGDEAPARRRVLPRSPCQVQPAGVNPFGGNRRVHTDSLLTLRRLSPTPLANLTSS